MENRKIAYFIGLILVFALINFFSFSSENNIITITSFILVLALIFLIFLLGHKKYNYITKKINPGKILILGYTLLALDILFQNKFYSIEWAFTIFVLSAVLFYDFKIDSRFLIFPAILFLGYIPFLLIGNYNTLAETIAVYIYYFLVVGVGLQFIENINKKDNSLNFDSLFETLKNKVPWISFIIVVGTFSIVTIITGRLYNLDLNFYKWTFVYLFSISIVFYLISLIKEE
jgi:hypothetical protein